MPKKEILINKILLILQKVAIDYYLYRKLSTSPKSSSIQVSEDDIKKIKGLRNTCPVKKRPVNNRCLEEGRVIKANNQGFDCCYKELKKKLDKNENKKDLIEKLNLDIWMLSRAIEALNKRLTLERQSLQKYADKPKIIAKINLKIQKTIDEIQQETKQLNFYKKQLEKIQSYSK
jgi:hypothetical protein